MWSGKEALLILIPQLLGTERAPCLCEGTERWYLQIRPALATTTKPSGSFCIQGGLPQNNLFHYQELTEQIHNISVHMFTCAAIGIRGRFEGVPEVPYAFCNIFKFIAVFQMTGNSGLPSSWEIFIHRQVKNPWQKATKGTCWPFSCLANISASIVPW